jgi:hypothetical protein
VLSNNGGKAAKPRLSEVVEAQLPDPRRYCSRTRAGHVVVQGHWVPAAVFQSVETRCPGGIID